MFGMKSLLGLGCLVLAPSLAGAQVGVMPGDAARRASDAAANKAAKGEPVPADQEAEIVDRNGAGEAYYNAWDAPAVVTGERGLREEELIGKYAQPRWTARRRFPTTRVYVRPEGQFAFEYWLRSTVDLENFGKASSKKYRSIYEFEYGLGHRLQLDIYLTAEQDGHGPIETAKESIELRYALADWGVLWANPTLYLEVGRHNGEENFVEAKLLLGGELGAGWHGGLNLVLERTVGGPETHEYKVTGGLSKTVVDTKFSVGAELEVEMVDNNESRFDFVEKKYVLGPSLSWQPSKHMTILFTPLFGIASEKVGNKDESTFIMQHWFVAGWNY